MVPDPYKILGLTHEASQDELKKAYRKLAMMLHPDRLTRMQATPEQIRIATSKFAAVTSAYSLLSDEKRKRDYDHIYKYGGFDDPPEKTTPQTKTYETSSTSKKRVPQMGIGYSICDPFTYIISQGKVRSQAVAGISIPSRFHMPNTPERGFRVSFSQGNLQESSSGSVHCQTTTTQFASGKKFSKVETTIIHSDGRKEVTIEGDDYIERRFSTAPKRKRRTSNGKGKDDLTHGGDELPWYMSAWNGLRDNLQVCATNPCGAISVA
jgi:curved DNA-binding protein CbpA